MGTTGLAGRHPPQLTGNCSGLKDLLIFNKFLLRPDLVNTVGIIPLKEHHHHKVCFDIGQIGNVLNSHLGISGYPTFTTI